MRCWKPAKVPALFPPASPAATRSVWKPGCRCTATNSPGASNAYAAGLGPVVALSKEGDFVGKEALSALKAAGVGSTVGQKLVGLKGTGRRAARAHYPVLKDGTLVGEVTSGQPSPTLGYPVAMAYVDIEFASVGTVVEVDLRGKPERFEVVDLPFYKRTR